MKKNIKRGLNPECIEAIKKSGLLDLYQEHQEELFIAIRNEYVNFYYNCASVCKIEYHPRKLEKLYCYVHKKYLGETITEEDKQKKKYYKEVTPQYVIENYEKIKNNIEKVYKSSKHQEKFAQQKLVKNNNLNKKSKWYCIDIEYIKQRNNSKEVQFGRWDIIAISKNKDKEQKHRVALIELKCTEEAISGDSGIVKHAEDYIKFIGEGKKRYKTYKEHLKPEIKNIVDSLNELNFKEIKINSIDEITDEPEFYFITLNNKNDYMLKTMRKYIFNDELGHAKETVEGKQKIDITKNNKKGFKPKFLFSDQRYYNVTINDILDEKQYDNIGLNIREKYRLNKKCSKIIIHRGTHQIGGCVTEIISKAGTKIAIDIGENLPSMDNEKKPKLYVQGLTNEKEGIKKVEAVFVTHYHGDHIGLYDKILKDIPIYIGKHSKKIYYILQERLANAKRIPKKSLKKIEKFQEYKADKTIPINNDIKVTPIKSDHSAFDAHMLLIECDGIKILHTGDFRLHGVNGKELLKNLQEKVGKVDYLICEGTTLSRESEKAKHENDLRKEAKKIFKDNKYNFVLCSSTNIDRIAEIHKAAISGHRLFICDKYQKKILDYINSVAEKENLGNLYKFGENTILSYGSNLIPLMDEKGFVMLVRVNRQFEEIMQNWRTDSKFIYSEWKGYLDENLA